MSTSHTMDKNIAMFSCLINEAVGNSKQFDNLETNQIPTLENMMEDLI